VTVWLIGVIVAAAGGIGGMIAALLSEDKGFVRPTKVTAATGTVYRPGWTGLILTGATAALLSWGLYGPVATAAITTSAGQSLTMSTICGAVLVGTGGSKWISSQVDKTLLQQAAGAAALADPATPAEAQTIATGTPLQALDTAKRIPAQQH
jgi:hypothetical protein